MTNAPAPAGAALSVMDLFTIGIGPSSSHTVGPMRAALDFARQLALLACAPTRLRCELHGSLSLTGRGHATDRAVLLGLAGHTPEALDPDGVAELTRCLRAQRALPLAGGATVVFDADVDLVFSDNFVPEHPNALSFSATLADGRCIEQRYYSVGGGAIVKAGAAQPASGIEVPLPFESAAELLRIGDSTGLALADIVRVNEAAWRPLAETDGFLDRVRAAMFACIERGCSTGGELPGGLRVRRRAPELHARLVQRGAAVDADADAASVLDWVSLYALAVNEENAAGGRVVTAPTNGAAGVIPAVLRYYESFVPGATPAGSRRFLYTASAIGFLYKKRASISAAEMGCQGEVGVACSMAAAGLAAVTGGSNRQVENAAEIGMEHNLGLTCDPVAGLVQIPCIERNTMGAVKAINAARLALHGDGHHIVSLDQVIETMRQTGEDMKRQYKETSLGGLAVNVVAC